MEIKLQRGHVELSLLPEIGGSVASLKCNGKDLLRPASPTASAARAPLETAGFPLFPFSGRIAQGRFPWNGRDVTLKPNFPPEAHAIHGHAWEAPWTVEETSTDRASLSFDYPAAEWPWSYRAGQVFTLTDGGLELTLSLTNLSHETMPAGLGWHPYFPRQDAQITLPVTGIWHSDENMIPSELSAPCEGSDLNEKRSVDSLVLDNAFTLAPARARIEWPQRGLAVDMVSDRIFSHVVVFTPPGQDYFCIEPVSHVPDAVNSPHAASVTGLVSLAPGETLSGSIRLSTSRL